MGICVAVGINYHSYTNHRLNANNLEQNGPRCSTTPFTPHSNIHTGKQRESQTGRNWEEGNWPSKQGGWALSAPWGRRGCGLGYRGLQHHWFGSISWPGCETAVFVLLWSSLREKGQLSSQHTAVMRWNYSGRNEIGRLSELKPEAQWWSLSLGLSWSPRTAGPSEGSPGDSARRHWWPSVSPTFELKRARRRHSLGDPAHRRCHRSPRAWFYTWTRRSPFFPLPLCTNFVHSFLPSFLHSVCSQLSQKPVTTEHSLNWPMFVCFYF